MPNTDKGVWLWWKVLASIVFVSTTFFIASHGTGIELNLTES